MSLKFCKLNDDAIIPQRQTIGSAGYDLHAIKSYSTGKGEIISVLTGIGVIIPEGYVGIIKARSSLSREYGVRVEAGVIDSDYRGEIQVLITCTSKRLVIDKNQRIAQLLIVKCLCEPSMEIFLDEFQSEKTERGSGGFGSTGTGMNSDESNGEDELE